MTQLYAALRNNIVFALTSDDDYNTLDELGKSRWTPAPEGTVPGSILNGDTWTHPAPPPEVPPSPANIFEAGYKLDKLDKATFYMLFTIHEETAIKALAKTDPTMATLVGRLDGAENVNMLLLSVKSAILMLAIFPQNFLVPSRVANILAGNYPTSGEMFQSLMRYMWHEANKNDPDPTKHYIAEPIEDPAP